MKTKNLIDQPVDSPCGIAVNPFTGNIYISSYNMVGGWPSYTTDGYVNEYSANGKFTNKYNVGVGPCGLNLLTEIIKIWFCFSSTFDEGSKTTIISLIN